MSKSKQSSPTLVSASTVRAFFQSHPDLAESVATTAKVSTNSVLGADGDASRIRGRINPAFVAAFAEHNKGQAYLEAPKGGVSDTRTVEIPRVSPKTGRPVKSTVLPMSEAKALAGHPANRKGLLSSADKVKVAEALAAAGR